MGDKPPVAACVAGGSANPAGDFSASASRTRVGGDGGVERGRVNGEASPEGRNGEEPPGERSGERCSVTSESEFWRPRSDPEHDSSCDRDKGVIDRVGDGTIGRATGDASTKSFCLEACTSANAGGDSGVFSPEATGVRFEPAVFTCSCTSLRGGALVGVAGGTGLLIPAVAMASSFSVGLRRSGFCAARRSLFLQSSKYPRL